MSKHKTTKMSYKKILMVVGIGMACAVLLKHDTPQTKA